MKRILSLITAAIAVQAAFAATVKVQIDDLYYNLDTTTKTASVTYDTSSTPSPSNPAYASFSDKNLTIPEKVEYSGEEYTVTSISNYAFRDCSGLTSVTFPEILININIDSKAFESCNGLKEVNIPSLEAWCKIKFGDYYANPNYYAKKLLIGGKELSGIVKLPKNLTKVSNYQFYNCTAVTEFVFPDGLTSIGENAFMFCSGLTSVSFPKSLTSIGYGAFMFCSGLYSVTFPDSNIKIASLAFSSCNGLKEVNIPSFKAWCNIKFSDRYSNPNYYAKNLLIDGLELAGKVILPEDWIEVPTALFAGCKAVTEFVFPTGLTSIGEYAFEYCSGLTSVSFSENLTSIRGSAFTDCTGIKEVYIPSFKAWCNIKFTNRYSNPNYYAKNLLIDGLELAGKVILPEDWIEVPTALFAGCKAVTEFVFPTGLTSIEYDAFINCTGLTSVNFPKSLKSIGWGSFVRCSGLTSVTLPKGLTSIGWYAFDTCTNLLKVVSLNPVPPTGGDLDTFSDPAESSGILFVPETSVETYRNTNYWNEFQNIQPIVVASDLELSAEKNPLTIGHTQQIIATLTPEDATVDQFIWNSSDKSVATVDGFGKVTALKIGTTTITAKTIDSSDIEATLELNVTDSNGSFAIEDFEMLLEEDLSVPVNLNLNFSDCHYSALQFDLTLPEDIELKSVVLGDQLLDAAMELTYKVQSNGDVRIIVTPTENLDGVNCTDDILFLNLTARENATPATSSILISNASLSTVKGADIFLENSSCTMTLRKLLLGDANDNGTVTVADVVTIANFIAKKEVMTWCFVNADVNRDKQITASDITGTVNIISNQDISPASLSRRARQFADDRLITDDFSPVEGETFNIGVRLDNTRQYSALQASIIIPEGMIIEGATKGSQAASHSLIYNITDDGRMEIVVFSTTNKPFVPTEGSLFDLVVRATADCGDIRMENILASDATATDYELQYDGGRNTGVSTGVESIYDLNPKVLADAQGITVYIAEGMNVSIYAVTGEIVANRVAMASPERFNLAKGIYVVTIDEKSFKIKI